MSSNLGGSLAQDPDNEVQLKRILRIFRNSVIDHIRRKFQSAFGVDCEQKIALLFAKKIEGSDITQWQRMKQNAERARASPEVSTFVADHFELLGVSDLFNVFEKYYEVLYEVPASSPPPVADGKKGLLRCLQQIKAFRDPNAHEVTEAISIDSLSLCLLNCKLVLDELGLSHAVKAIHEIQHTLLENTAPKHVTLVGLGLTPEEAALGKLCFSQGNIQVYEPTAAGLIASRNPTLNAAHKNIVLHLGSQLLQSDGAQERAALNAVMEACGKDGANCIVLTEASLSKAGLVSILEEPATSYFPAMPRFPVIAEYIEVLSKKVQVHLRRGMPQRDRVVAARVIVPAAQAVHDDKLGGLIFSMIRDPELLSARIVAPFASDVTSKVLGSISAALIEAKRRGCSISFITRPPSTTERDARGKLRFLELLHKENIDIFINPRLHSKVYLFERKASRTFWAVGSHNLTDFAHGGKSIETSLIGYRRQEFDEAYTSFERARRNSETYQYSAWKNRQI